MHTKVAAAPKTAAAHTKDAVGPDHAGVIEREGKTGVRKGLFSAGGTKGEAVYRWAGIQRDKVSAVRGNYSIVGRTRDLFGFQLAARLQFPPLVLVQVIVAAWQGMIKKKAAKLQKCKMPGLLFVFIQNA